MTISLIVFVTHVPDSFGSMCAPSYLPGPPCYAQDRALDTDCPNLPQATCDFQGLRATDVLWMLFIYIVLK